jgi:cytochrome b561
VYASPPIRARASPSQRARGHLALYALLLTILVLGVLDTWVRGDSIFGLFRIPRLGDLAPPARHALAERIVALHELAANLLLWPARRP